jgi:hypothetical protein
LLFLPGGFIVHLPLRRKAARPSFKLAALAVLSSAALLGLSGCGSSDAVSTTTVANTPPVAALTSVARYQIVLRNAANNALITDPVAITLSGVGTVNMSGVATTSFTTSDGLVAFATTPGVAAGGTLRVSTLSRAAGWTDGDEPVTVRANAAIQTIEIKLTNINRIADIPAAVPVAAAAAPVAVTGGVTTTQTAVVTPPKVVTTITGGTVTLPPISVAMPPATRITNAAGQTPTGPLTLTAVAQSLDTADGRAAIPGGGLPTASGTPAVAGLVTLLATDATGARFTNFSNPVTAQIPVASDTRTTDQSRLLAAGDTYPVRVWNATTNDWDLRATGTVKAASGGLVVEFPTSSFSQYAAAFFPTTVTCINTINIVGRPAGDTTALTVEAYNSVRGDTVTGVTGNTLSVTTVAVEGSSGGDPRVVVRGPESLVTQASGRCNAQITVNMNFPAPPPGAVSGNVTESCPNGSNSSGLPGWVALMGTGSNTTILAVPSAEGTGAFSFTGVAAGTYNLKISPQNKAERTIGNVVVGTTNVTVPNTQLNYPDRACTTISG